MPLILYLSLNPKLLTLSIWLCSFYVCFGTEDFLLLRALEHRKNCYCMQYEWLCFSCLLLVLQVSSEVLVSWSLHLIMAFLAWNPPVAVLDIFSRACMYCSGSTCWSILLVWTTADLQDEDFIRGDRVSGLPPCVFQVVIYTKLFSGINRCREVEDISCSRSFYYAILFSQEIVAVMEVRAIHPQVWWNWSR